MVSLSHIGLFDMTLAMRSLTSPKKVEATSAVTDQPPQEVIVTTEMNVHETVLPTADREYPYDILLCSS